MKLKKVVTIISILFLCLNTICFADIDTGSFRPDNLTASDYGKTFEMAGTIVGALKIVGTVIAIVGLMVLGIKYMIGSVEQKADYKKTMIPYLVGCIFIFAIGQIVSIIYSLAIKIK